MAPGSARPAVLREELRWLGFGPIGALLYAHPSGAAETRAALAALPGAKQALLFKSRIVGGAGAQALAARAWDLEGLAARYARFTRRFAPLLRARPGALTPQAAFLARTLLVHEYRKIHLQDPLLPARLLPARWAGARAYRVAAAIYAQTFKAAEAFLSATAQRLDGPLPPPAPELRRRFGRAPR